MCLGLSGTHSMLSDSSLSQALYQLDESYRSLSARQLVLALTLRSGEAHLPLHSRCAAQSNLWLACQKNVGGPYSKGRISLTDTKRFRDPRLGAFCY
jgi:hypothetical protein